MATAAETAVAAGAVSSNGEARRLIAQGGLYCNDIRVAAADEVLPVPSTAGSGCCGPARRTSGSSSGRTNAQRRRSRRTSITSAGVRPRSARTTSAWYSRSADLGDRCRVAPDRARCLGRRVVLGGNEDFVASSVTLRAARRRLSRSAGGVGALGRFMARSAIVDHSDSSQANPCGGRRRSASLPSKHDRVPRWQVGPAASAVTRSASASQSAAMSTTRRTLPLVSPLRQSRLRDREEVDIAGRDRRVERLAVHPRQHQDRAVASVSHDAGARPSAPKRTVVGSITRRSAGPTGRPPPSPP